MPTLKETGDSSASEHKQQTLESPYPEPVGFGGGEQTQDAKEVTSVSSTEVEKSTDAKEDAEPTSLMDAVTKALSKDKEDKATVESSTTTTSGEADATSETKTEETQAEVPDEKLPFHEHPRWKQVIAERNAFEDKASRFDQVVNFMHSNDLTSQEFEQGASIMALMKRDPVAALEQLRPIYDNLQRFVGEKLPPDLADKVEQGFLDEDSAREVAASRNKAQFVENRSAQEQQRQREFAQRTQAEQQHNTIHQAVVAWEENIKSRDPDYQAKSDFLTDRFKALVRENPPRTQQEAIKLAEQAHTEVTERMKSLLPKKGEVKVVTSRSSSASSAVQSPRSLLEVAQAALKR